MGSLYTLFNFGHKVLDLGLDFDWDILTHEHTLILTILLQLKVDSVVVLES